MSHSRKPRGPIGRVGGLRRVEGADAILRVRALERVSGPQRVESNDVARRSFSEALERASRGLHSSEPLPTVHRPSPPPARRTREEDEPMTSPEPPPESFMGILWWKMRGHR
ncbi:hypothetical protein SAMN05443572_102147 [Myxococcus fulvus]|uniref:Uncharacterized protein n=1 Tax=Myxococcus fulvus TaxID=33 RepID=A0A511TD15_MYXFU|nr:hypothetical protein [Myxococcus fulvus]AKF86739.1 hypothetical protein MFUL124B02_32035 [Myxococcus fulvus 124B02]GEN11028.1 hypothetical protein MFU01_60650 [Myxococcus fulvus]SET40101.1 hypothetical protein SAMN05443572_102147 [Myxococcus fulvus]